MDPSPLARFPLLPSLYTRLMGLFSRSTCGVRRDSGMTHQAGNTYSTERICARGGAPGDTAHGQILALFTVAAAFRATRRRHNLGRVEDRSPHKSGARTVGGPWHLAAPTRPAQRRTGHGGFRQAGHDGSPSFAQSCRATKGLRVALRGRDQREELFIGRKKKNKERDRGEGWGHKGTRD